MIPIKDIIQNLEDAIQKMQEVIQSAMQNLADMVASVMKGIVDTFLMQYEEEITLACGGHILLQYHSISVG